MTEMLEAALSYVAEGFAVFPVKPDKTPLTKHGLKDATRIQIGVKEYWTKWPEAGIGLVTDGLVVLDFDAKSGGEESWQELKKLHGEFPPTRTHRTGGGGRHYIYRSPNGTTFRNTTVAGGYQGVDIRANGGYIVAPPSPHESGRAYEVIDSSDVVTAPDWLVALALTKKTVEATGEGSITEGQRNATLASLAGTMRRRGMPESSIEAALLDLNASQSDPPLPDEEVRAIAKSVSRYAAEPTTEEVKGQYKRIGASTHEYRWTDVTLRVTRLHERSDGIVSGELLITVAGNRVSQGRMSLTSSGGLEKEAKALTKKHPNLPWETLLENMAYEVLEHIRIGEELQIFSVLNEDIPTVQYLASPFILEQQPVVFFGDGGVGKSRMALIFYLILGLPWRLIR